MTLEPNRSVADIRYEIATDDFRRALFRLERHFNPNWPLQPRLPRGLGQRVSGTWTDGDGVVIPASTSIITHLTREVVRFAVRRALPYLRKPPRRWSGRGPNENEFDEIRTRCAPNATTPGAPLRLVSLRLGTQALFETGGRRSLMASYRGAATCRQRPISAGMDPQHRQRHRYSGYTPSVHQCRNEQNKTAQWRFDCKAMAGT